MAATDLIVIGIMAITLIFTVVFTGVMWAALFPAMQDSVLNDTAGVYESWIAVDNVFKLFDGAIIIAQIILILGLLLSVYFLNTHPAFFIVMIFINIISIFLGGIYSALWTEMVTNSDINATVNTYFPSTSVMVNNYAVIMTIIGFIFVIILYAKIKGGGIR